MKTHDLERLQLILTTLARARGPVRLKTLAARVGMTPEALRLAVDRLQMVHGADDDPLSYVDIAVDATGEWVDLNPGLDQGLGRRPLALTASEVCALGFAVRALKDWPDPAIARAADEALRAALRGAADRPPSDLPVAPAPAGDPLLELLVQATRDRLELRIDYLAASRDEATTRTVRPVALVQHEGHWYLQADCLLRGDRRFFRADRIARAEPTGATFPPPAPPDRALPVAPPSGGHAEVRFDRAVAGWVRERFAAGDVTDLPGGGVVVRVPVSSPVFLAAWVVSFAGRAAVVSPPALRDEVRRRVEGAFGAPVPLRSR